MQYEILEMHRAELIRQAEEQRLVREVTDARRAVKRLGRKREGRVDSSQGDRFARAA